MPTIVVYTEDKKAVKMTRDRIVSPLNPGPCCSTHMKPIGKPQQENVLTFQYKRCQHCGYTVRVFSTVKPDKRFRELLKETEQIYRPSQEEEEVVK